MADLVLSHGFLKGAFFLAAGILMREFRSVDELELHGRGTLGTAVLGGVWLLTLTRG